MPGVDGASGSKYDTMSSKRKLQRALGGLLPSVLVHTGLCHVMPPSSDWNIPKESSPVVIPPPKKIGVIVPLTRAPGTVPIQLYSRGVHSSGGSVHVHVSPQSSLYHTSAKQRQNVVSECIRMWPRCGSTAQPTCVSVITANDEQACKSWRRPAR